MKKMRLFSFFLLASAALSNCTPGLVCTTELRTISLQVKSPTGMAVTLDSFYTIRQSNGERIRPDVQSGPGYYIVLDDSYHSRLRKSKDDFRFVGWRNNSIAVDEMYHVSADECHINKRSGAESVVVQ